MLSDEVADTAVRVAAGPRTKLRRAASRVIRSDSTMDTHHTRKGGKAHARHGALRRCLAACVQLGQDDMDPHVKEDDRYNLPYPLVTGLHCPY